jgi:hypothetical protein
METIKISYTKDFEIISVEKEDDNLSRIETISILQMAIKRIAIAEQETK